MIPVVSRYTRELVANAEPITSGELLVAAGMAGATFVIVIVGLCLLVRQWSAADTPKPKARKVE